MVAPGCLNKGVDKIIFVNIQWRQIWGNYGYSGIGVKNGNGVGSVASREETEEKLAEAISEKTEIVEEELMSYIASVSHSCSSGKYKDKCMDYTDPCAFYRDFL